MTCPYCGYVGAEAEFDESLCGECWCPKCGREFMLEDEGDEDDED